jgi:hypothetical protein
MPIFSACALNAVLATAALLRWVSGCRGSSAAASVHHNGDAGTDFASLI